MVKSVVNSHLSVIAASKLGRSIVAKTKGRMMRAHEARTGDRLVQVSDGRGRLVTQATNSAGTVVLAHGPYARTETPADAWVRVIRPTRTAKASPPERAECGIAFHPPQRQSA